jgi:3,4-dihydroxy 2-butanone 4-phosphate synthase/GTP cyclohydrolase II
MTTFATIEDALEDYRNGKFLLVTDDEARENEGDLIIAAQFADARAVNFMAKNARGLICVPMEGARLEAMQLAPMTANNTDRHATAFATSVDAHPRFGVTTGISASDRARAVQLLISEETRPSDLTRPGHTFPLRAREGGVLVRAGHTEAGIDLCKLAGLYPAAVICEILNEDGDSANLPELQALAREHDIKIITIEALIRYRRQHEKLVNFVAEARLPTIYGEFRAVAYQSVLDGTPYVALVKGEIAPDQPILVRVHSGCLTGDALSSLRCDCGEQLHAAMSRINEAGAGVLLYIDHHEGRGIGIINKIRAYALQDKGADTEQANHALGFASDLREYGTGAQVLTDLGVRQMRLLTNNPSKRVGLDGYGLQIVERVPLQPTVNEENKNYLETKRDKMGHLLDGLGERLGSETSTRAKLDEQLEEQEESGAL